jgi:hypothetical protein
VLPGVGHMVPKTQPAVIAEAVRGMTAPAIGKH